MWPFASINLTDTLITGTAWQHAHIRVQWLRFGSTGVRGTSSVFTWPQMNDFRRYEYKQADLCSLQPAGALDLRQVRATRTASLTVWAV